MATVAPSVDDLIAVGLAELQTRRPDLDVNSGDITEAMLHAIAAMADAIIRDAALKFKNTFIDGATGADLTALADDHYSIQRQEATSSQVTISWSRDSSAGSGVITAGTQIATEFDANGSSIVFSTDNSLSFSAAELGPLTVTATSQNTGRETNVASATVTRIIDVPAFENNFTITNNSPSAGGNDQETDRELRERVRSYFKTLRRGTLDALEDGAKTIATVRTATASEDANDLVTLYVADSDGNSTAEMISDVSAILSAWKAAGTTVSVLGGAKSTINMTVTIDSSRTGFDVTAAASNIASAIAGRIDRLGVGETLYLDTIIAAAIAAYPDDIYDISITSITKGGVSQSIDDVSASSNEVMRSGTITVS